MKISQFERNQCLQRLRDPGAAKTVRDMDLILCIIPLVNKLFNLSYPNLSWGQVEARQKTISEQRWVVHPKMNPNQIIDCGDKNDSELIANAVNNALGGFKQKISKNENHWIVSMIGDFYGGIDFGTGANAEQNARYVAGVLNAVNEFRNGLN